jgi:serine/threonine protein kinase, bacterial
MASANQSSSAKETRIIRAIQKLSHRHLLRIQHVWSIPDYIVVAMELADGSLFDMLDLYQAEYHTALPPVLAAGYLKQAALALDYLNARRHTFEGKTIGFMHCDVKPSNLLLVGEMVKLADFGLCTPTVALQSSYAKAGTLDFAAPEVHRGSLSDTSDQYSLAVTYYHLRTGTFPFPPPPARFDRTYSYSRPAPDLNQVRRSERQVLERALDLEPTNRWPSCVAMMNALTQALNESDPDSPAGSPESPVPASVCHWTPPSRTTVRQL